LRTGAPAPTSLPARMLKLTRFDRYIARRIIVPLVGTVAVAAMLLVLDRMLRLFDFVVREGGPVWVVWRLLGNLLPEYLGLGVPIGLLLGILLAFRKLAINSELDALRAAGISYDRMLRVPYMFAALMAFINLLIVGYIQPVARYSYEQLRYELRSGALGASVKVGEFAQLGPRTTLRVERAEDNGRELYGIFVRAEPKSGGAITITAARGAFLATDDPDTIQLRLREGSLVQENPRYSAPRVLTFQEHSLPISLPKMEGFRARGQRELELTLPELVRTGGDRATPAAFRVETIAATQRRIIQVVVMAVLPLLAVALAVPPKRSSSGLGIMLGIVMLVGFHKVSEYTERVGGAGRLDPVWGQWVPFLLFCALCVWMYRTLAYKPGGQPLGAVERWLERAQKRAAALIPRPAPADAPVAA